jgi:hypothetical protein
MKSGIALTSDWMLNSIPMSEKNIGAKNPNVIAEMMP